MPSARPPRIRALAQWLAAGGLLLTLLLVSRPEPPDADTLPTRRSLEPSTPAEQVEPSGQDDLAHGTHAEPGQTDVAAAFASSRERGAPNPVVTSGPTHQEASSPDSGPCPAPLVQARRRQREALLTGFIQSPTAGWSFRHDPSVGFDQRLELARWLDEARLRARSLLGNAFTQKAPPDILLYRDGDQLRSGTCVSIDAVGYYDGAIHVIADAEAGPTLVHEYIHHLLAGRRVALPEWLEEGLAMNAAQEDWWLAPGLELTQWLRLHPLRFGDLTDELPGREHDGAGGLAYAQSAAMVRFLQHRRSGVDFSALLEGIETGRVPRERAFEHASGLSGEALVREWESFIGTLGAP